MPVVEENQASDRSL